MDALDHVLDALKSIRCPQLTDEYDLHAIVADALQNAEIEFIHEAKLAARCRIDFLCGRIAIECKRGKIDQKAVVRQLEKYVAQEVDALILVSEHAISLPDTIYGKTVRQISLSQLWGIATDTYGHTFQLDEDPVAEEASAFRTDDIDDTAEWMQGPKGQIPENNFEGLPPGAVTGGAETEGNNSFGYGSNYGCPAWQEMTSVDIPAYLKKPEVQPDRYVGTLHFIKRSRVWQIKAEPQVISALKRLWPSAHNSRHGEIRRYAGRHTTEDISWIMQRWPLAMSEADQAAWDTALNEAQVLYRLRIYAEKNRIPAEPPAAAFEGELMDFQKIGLSFLLMTPRALLADEMGLGKTVQALAAVGTLRAFPVLLIVPPHLVLNWTRETERFLRINGTVPRIHVIRGLTPYPLPDADVYIIHYLLLQGWKQVLPQKDFRMVIFDEIQELRHTGSEKYSAASLLTEGRERVIGLSGTPIYNRGAEIWSIVNILEYHFLGDYESFTREWCTGYGNQIVRYPEQLGAYLRSEGLMLRRTKKEVLPELPEKRRLVQQIDHDDRLYQKMMEPVYELLRRMNAPDLTPSERALLENEVSQGERQATGLSKVPFVCQFVRALVEAGEAVLLFAHHHSVMDTYQRELRSLHPAFITGRETTVQKEESAARFMDGRTDLCCVSLRAASGLNLQRATCVVFGELDWSPAVHAQAEDRAHRIGHQDSLLCYYLVAPEGSDMIMQEALGLKVSQFAGLMGEAPQSEEAREADANYARKHVEELLRRKKSGTVYD